MDTEPDRAPVGLPGDVLEHLLEGLQVISEDFRYQYVNEAVVVQAKRPRTRLLGARMEDVYPGIEQTAMFSVLRRCMEDRCRRHMENQFVYPDGSTGWFELRFEPVPRGVAILSIDITRRKRTERALERLVRVQRTLSRSNQALVRAQREEAFVEEIATLLHEEGGYPLVCIVVTKADAGGNLQPAAIDDFVCAGEDGAQCWLDQAEMRELLRWAQKQEDPTLWMLRGQPGDDLQEPVEGLVPSLRQHGSVGFYALPIERAQQRLGTVVLFAFEQLAFEEQERACLQEIVMDLGYGIQTLRARIEHQHAVQRLDEERVRTQIIYDHLPGATLVFERDEETFSLLDLNQRAQLLMHVQSNEVVGQRPDFLEAILPQALDDLQRCYRERRMVRRELDCMLPGYGGGERTLSVIYGYIPPSMVLMHLQDVTEQRHTERQLVASQRLEAVGRLAGGVAHDFNNMLSIILTLSGFSLERLAEEHSPLRDDLEQIQEAGQRAADLTRQLLAFSRRQVLEPEVMNINDSVTSVEVMLRRLLGENIDISVELAEDVGLIVADGGQLEQVIVNLAVNARDAMPDGGKLTLETGNVELDEVYVRSHVDVEPGSFVCLTVTDNGVGMDAETRDQVFEPFFTTKEEGKGTGLGLSTTYGIVKQSGGHIWVYSEPDRGTSFKLYFPRVVAELEEEVERAEPSEPQSGEETILLVEDEPGVRRAVARILRRSGYQVLEAEDGHRGLELFHAHQGQVALLLTDIVMPSMDGRELAQELMEREPELRVLFTSGYTGNAIKHQGLLEPGVSFIGKPFSAPVLAAKIREILD